MSNTHDLSTFLAETKAKYLAAVQDGSAKDWTVVMGNEAGDLDTVASSIGLSWYLNVIRGTPSVALQQTPRSDLRLRAENLHALSLAGLSEGVPELLCISDLPPYEAFPSHKFALVDHNSLGARFRSPDATVVAIVDHHADEGEHTNANPRIVQPVGSAASLVAGVLEHEAPNAVPAPLARLLLCATIVDTKGLKPGGKGTPVDVDAARFLLVRSGTYEEASLQTASLDMAAVNGLPAIADLNNTLQSIKVDVSQLSTSDLLRRDYKEYTFAPGARVGLASVPIGLKKWFSVHGGQFWSEAAQFLETQQLDALGVLTSFRDEETLTLSGKPKHLRQQLWLVRAWSELPTKLFPGLEANDELGLEQIEPKVFGDAATVPESLSDAWEVRVYKQKNEKATRKVTAPVVRAIIVGDVNIRKKRLAALGCLALLGAIGCYIAWVRNPFFS